MIAIVTLNVKVGDVEGFMNVCLPFFTLEDVMDKLNTKYWELSKHDQYLLNDHQLDLRKLTNLLQWKPASSQHAVQHESLIRKVDIPVRAVLGKSTISVNDFMNLQIGDCIRLNSKVDDDMNIFVGNIKKFTKRIQCRGRGAHADIGHLADRVEPLISARRTRRCWI